MKKNYKYFMLVIISFMMATFAACTMDATNTDDPSNPNPPINNDPPIEDIEKRKVTMIKIDREGYEEFYYFNYDQKDRVKRITTVESDTDPWYYIMDIDYSSQQIIKLTSGNEEIGYSDEYISLNDMGYIESYDEEEYTYDSNGFIKRITLEDYDSKVNFKWQNGNISRVDEEENDDYDVYNFTYNTNKNSLTTIDLSYFVTYFCSEVSFPSGLGCIGLAGKSSTNYVTSIARKTNDSDGDSELYNVSFKWGYDEDGYPTICLISSEWIYDNQRESVEYTVEISYYDETGEVDPELPQGDTPTTSGDIKLSANKTAIELGETITFTAEQKSDSTGEFIDVTKDITLYDADLNKLPNPFTPTTTGVLSVTATKGKYVSNTLTITVMAQMPDVPAETQAWIGTWNAKTSQILSMNVSEAGGLLYDLSAQESNFTFTIATSTYGPDIVMIDGLSVLGEGNPTFGYVDKNTLTISTNLSIGYDANGNNYIWLPCVAVDGQLLGLNNFDGEVPAHVLTMAEDGTVTCETGKFAVRFNDGTEAEAEVVSTDVFALSPDGYLNFLGIEEFPAVYRAGAMEVTKAATPTAKVLNKPAKNYSLMNTSVVLR